MLNDRVFQIAFVISLVTHGVILFQNSGMNILPKNKSAQKLEVSYIKAPQEKREEPKLSLPKITRRAPPPFVEKENFLKGVTKGRFSEISLSKPTLIKPDIIAIKKKITLPAIDMHKVSSALYISYYQIVREKIRRSAYQNYNRSETGEIYLSFIVSSDGFLREIKLIDEKSTPNPYLKEVSLRSIKEASPFPVFPKELDYPQLSFNVVISFEIES